MQEPLPENRATSRQQEKGGAALGLTVKNQNAFTQFHPKSQWQGKLLTAVIQKASFFPALCWDAWQVADAGRAQHGSW